MIEREDYKLKIMMNGVDIGLDNSYFVSFTLTENLNYNFYFAELGLKQNLYWDFLWTTREEVTIDIQYQKGDTVSLHQQAKSETKSYEHKTYNFLIYNYVLSSDTILITLVPSYFPKLFVEKITAGYNEKMEEVVSEGNQRENVR